MLRLALILALLLAAGVPTVDAQVSSAEPAQSTAKKTASGSAPAATQPTTNSSKLQVTQISPPQPKARNGDTLFVFYTGKLANGTVFDSNEGGQLFRFILGSGQVIKGWDQGLIGTEVGEKVHLVIPSSLAYGPSQHASIPANSTLYFDVQVVGLVRLPQ